MTPTLAQITAIITQTQTALDSLMKSNTLPLVTQANQPLTQPGVPVSRKDTIRYPLFLAHSLTADFFSPVTLIEWMDNFGYQINITTVDSAGTFSVQVSNDYQLGSGGTVINPGNWIDLTLSVGTPTVASVNDQIVISLTQLPYGAIRLSYIPTIAGTGIADCYIIVKQLA